MHGIKNKWPVSDKKKEEENMRIKNWFNLFNFVIAVIFALCLAVPGFAQAPSQEKAEQKKGPQPSLGVEEPKDAGTFFKEAQKVAPNDPIGAIGLYQRGLVLKPDAWAERRQLGVLYEKQQQWSPAISEYEAINKATGSKESFADLVRAMDQAGFSRSAATYARRGFEKYPGEPGFLYLAGESFRKAGAEKDAVAALQEYVRLKPDDGKAFFLLGSIHEKAGRKADALRAYLRAGELMKNDRDANDAVKRLQAGAVNVEGLTIFLPQKWLPDKNGLVNIEEGQRIAVTVAASGDPAAIALKAARESMPQGLFTDEAMKSYERLRKMREEAMKARPESAKQMQSAPIPFFATRDAPGPAGSKMALLSTGEVSYPGIESAVALAVPSGGKVYTMIWRAAGPVNDGEKALAEILKQAVWPM